MVHCKKVNIVLRASSFLTYTGVIPRRTPGAQLHDRESSTLPSQFQLSSLYIYNNISHGVNIGCMKGDVVYCSQNAMFFLRRKMLKILYQMCDWSTSVRNAVYITPVYVDAIKILGVHISFIAYHCFTSLNLLANNIKSQLQLYQLQSKFYNL